MRQFLRQAGRLLLLKKQNLMKQQELIQKLKQDVQGLIETIEHSFLDLSIQELNYKESKDCWSALECIEHLNRYNRYYNPAIKKAVANTSAVATVEFSSTWMGGKFIDMMRPENKKKQKTFARMNPAGSNLSKDILHEFITHQQELLALLNEVQSKDLTKGKVSIEFFKLLSFNLGDAFQFVVVHQQRHMLQALKAIRVQSSSKSTLVTF